MIRAPSALTPVARPRDARTMSHLARTALRFAMLCLAPLLAACDKGEPAADTKAKTASEAESPAAKPADAKPPEAVAKAPDAKAPEAVADAKAPEPPQPEADTALPPPSPPPEATPGAAAEPTGPVVVHVGDEEEGETELDLAHETIGGVHVGMPAADVLAKLGKPKKQSKLQKEGATGGYEQTWHYEGLEVWMWSETRKGAQKVALLEASAACKLPASWGLGIGSTRAAVEKVYAAAVMPDLSGPDQLLAGSPYAGVTFTFQDEKVTGILMGGGE